MSDDTRTINVNYLARVEGEGALYIRSQGDKVEACELRIFEPPRFFEGFLRGRYFTEAPDITARICGICPVAYMMGSSHAMEAIAGVNPGTEIPQIRELRRLLYCGEWIESHVLHIYMLHAPDFMDYPDAIAMGRDYPELVRSALRLKKLGNSIMSLLGGREIHPVNVRVGGFYKAPTKAELRGLVDELEWGVEAAEQTARLVSRLPFPRFEQDYEFISLRHPEEYPFNEGRMVSNKGMDVPINEYDDVLKEEHVAHSTALQSRVVGRGPAHMGPLARYANNRDKLTPRARAAAEAAGLGVACFNPFKSIIARAVEVIFACEEALRLIDHYKEPSAAYVETPPRAGTGYGATEAPRGICYHRYTVDDQGIIQDGKIVAPTSVNQAVIEHDLSRYVAPLLSLPDDEIKAYCEQAIRNYDPCISCSTHFLDLTVDRR